MNKVIKVEVNGKLREELIPVYNILDIGDKLNGVEGEICIKKTTIPDVYIIYDDSFCSDVEDYSILDKNYNKFAKEVYPYGVYGNFYLVLKKMNKFEDYTIEEFENDR